MLHIAHTYTCVCANCLPTFHDGRDLSFLFMAITPVPRYCLAHSRHWVFNEWVNEWIYYKRQKGRFTKQYVQLLCGMHSDIYFFPTLIFSNSMFYSNSGTVFYSNSDHDPLNWFHAYLWGMIHSLKNFLFLSFQIVNKIVAFDYLSDFVLERQEELHTMSQRPCIYLRLLVQIAKNC